MIRGGGGAFALNLVSPPHSVNVCVYPVHPTPALIKARKRHININFIVRLVLGQPQVCPGDFTGFVCGTNSVKPWTNPEFLLILHSGSPANPGLSEGQTRVCPWDKPWGRRAAQKVYVKKVYVPFLLAIDPDNNHARPPPRGSD